MSAQGSLKTTPDVGRTGDGKEIAVLPVPGNADTQQPVECQNDVTFTNRSAVVQVFKDFVVEGELVVHGSVTVHGYAEFKGNARARFGLKPSRGAKNLKYSSAQGTPTGKNLKYSSAQGMPTVILQKMVAESDSYIYREGLTCLKKNNKVIINGDLVVDGNFTAQGPARFQKKRVSFGGGVDFETDPIIDEK